MSSGFEAQYTIHCDIETSVMHEWGNGVCFASALVSPGPYGRCLLPQSLGKWDKTAITIYWRMKHPTDIENRGWIVMEDANKCTARVSFAKCGYFLKMFWHQTRFIMASLSNIKIIQLGRSDAISFHTHAHTHRERERVLQTKNTGSWNHKNKTSVLNQHHSNIYNYTIIILRWFLSYHPSILHTHTR